MIGPTPGEVAGARIRMLRAVLRDLEADMTRLDGQPFTAQVAGRAFGQLAAQIHAVARVLLAHLEDEA